MAEQPTVVIEFQVSNYVVQPEAFVTMQVYEVVQPSVTVEMEVTHPVVQPEVEVTMQVYDVVQPSVDIEYQVFGVSSPFWKASVIMGGVDVSDQITGTIYTRQGKNAAGIASFNLIPETGGFDPLAWVGQAVTIDRIDLDSNRREIGRTRCYRGKIGTPKHSPDPSIVSMHCTTDIQGAAEAMDRVQIKALTGGRHSPHVFKEDVTNWQYMLDRLSTRTAFAWTDQNGQIRVTDWTAKATPDFTFTEDDYIAGSVKVSRVDKSRLINRIRSILDFQYDRFKQRNVYFDFRWTKSLCEFLEAEFELPERSMIQEAAEGAGWDLLGSIRFIDAWPPQLVDCNQGRAGGTGKRIWGYKAGLEGVHNSPFGSPEDLSKYCIGASFTLGTRWAQAVLETYTLDVRAPDSIASNGELARESGYGIEAESDANAWEQEKSYGFTIAGEGNVVAGGLQGMPAGAVELSNGDWLFEASQAEVTGREAMREAQLCMLDKEVTAIKASHRENPVVFSVLYTPVTLDHTVRLETQTVTTQGKVDVVENHLNTDNGSDITVITLGISQSGGVGIVSETPLSAIEFEAPDPETEYPRSIWLDWHIGGRTDSLPYNPDWVGYIANYKWDPTATDVFATDPADPETVIYQEEFAVGTLDIGEEDRRTIGAEVNRIFYVDIPNDELSEAAA